MGACASDMLGVKGTRHKQKYTHTHIHILQFAAPARCPPQSRGSPLLASGCGAFSAGLLMGRPSSDTAPSGTSHGLILLPLSFMQHPLGPCTGAVRPGKPCVCKQGRPR